MAFRCLGFGMLVVMTVSIVYIFHWYMRYNVDVVRVSSPSEFTTITVTDEPFLNPEAEELIMTPTTMVKRSASSVNARKISKRSGHANLTESSSNISQELEERQTVSPPKNTESQLKGSAATRWAHKKERESKKKNEDSNHISSSNVNKRKQSKSKESEIHNKIKGNNNITSHFQADIVSDNNTTSNVVEKNNAVLNLSTIFTSPSEEIVIEHPTYISNGEQSNGTLSENGSPLKNCSIDWKQIQEIEKYLHDYKELKEKINHERLNASEEISSTIKDVSSILEEKILLESLEKNLTVLLSDESLDGGEFYPSTEIPLARSLEGTTNDDVSYVPTTVKSNESIPNMITIDEIGKAIGSSSIDTSIINSEDGENPYDMTDENFPVEQTTSITPFHDENKNTFIIPEGNSNLDKKYQSELELSDLLLTTKPYDEYMNSDSSIHNADQTTIPPLVRLNINPVNNFDLLDSPFKMGSIISDKSVDQKSTAPDTTNISVSKVDSQTSYTKTNNAHATVNTPVKYIVEHLKDIPNNESHNPTSFNKKREIKMTDAKKLSESENLEKESFQEESSKNVLKVHALNYPKHPFLKAESPKNTLEKQNNHLTVNATNDSLIILQETPNTTENPLVEKLFFKSDKIQTDNEDLTDLSAKDEKDSKIEKFNDSSSEQPPPAQRAHTSKLFFRPRPHVTTSSQNTEGVTLSTSVDKDNLDILDQETIKSELNALLKRIIFNMEILHNTTESIESKNKHITHSKESYPEDENDEKAPCKTSSQYSESEDYENMLKTLDDVHFNNEMDESIPINSYKFKRENKGGKDIPRFQSKENKKSKLSTVKENSYEEIQDEEADNESNVQDRVRNFTPSKTIVKRKPLLSSTRQLNKEDQESNQIMEQSDEDTEETPYLIPSIPRKKMKPKSIVPPLTKRKQPIKLPKPLKIDLKTLLNKKAKKPIVTKQTEKSVELNSEEVLNENGLPDIVYVPFKNSNNLDVKSLLLFSNALSKDENMNYLNHPPQQRQETVNPSRFSNHYYGPSSTGVGATIESSRYNNLPQYNREQYDHGNSLPDRSWQGKRKRLADHNDEDQGAQQRRSFFNLVEPTREIANIVKSFQELSKQFKNS